MLETVAEHHPLKKPSTRVDRAARPQAPSWPSFTGTSQFVGTSRTGKVTVFVDPALGPAGLQNARDLLSDADRIVAANDVFFGIPGGPVSVIIFAIDGATDATGGADHMGCDFVTGAAIEVCASFGSPQRVSALFEAELSECSMGGNLCGVSTGEALSRWCAAAVSNNALSDFATAPVWAGAGHPDFVNRTEPTDRNPVSTGCGIAFLSWLLSQGHDLNTIAPAMVSLGDSGTLAQLYANLTGDVSSNAFPTFMEAVRRLAGGITTDDPFGKISRPALVGQLDASTIELAGRVFSGILADIAAGRSAQYTVTNVRTMMMRAAKLQGVSASCSTTTSHRLFLPGKTPVS